MKRFIWFLLLLVVATLSLTACGEPTAAPDDSATEETSSDSADATTAAPTYEVQIDPADFTAVVDNPYFPLIPGSRFVYEGQTEGGLERVEVEVLSETKEVMGVQTTVIRDTVYLEGVLIEDTFDWYAQHKNGDVWYFGEDVDNYENGVLVDHHGSWEGGVDGALPGIIMYADPASHSGQPYYQEFYVDEAEDQAKVLSATEKTVVPAGSFENVVQTEDWTRLEPALREHKFYAPGVGLIKGVNLQTGVEITLLEMTAP